jgi:hypothetical protein
VQHERDPLLWGQVVEHDERGHPHLFVAHDRLEWIITGLRAVGRDDRLGQPRADVLLTLDGGRPQPVEADAADDGGQPAAQVADLGPACLVQTGQPQPRLLDRVLGVGDRAGQPVRDTDQVTAVRGELLGENLIADLHTRNPTVGEGA